MRVTGLEPAHLTAPEPKSGVSANFTTPAFRITVLCDLFSIAHEQQKVKIIALISRYTMTNRVYCNNKRISMPIKAKISFMSINKLSV